MSKETFQIIETPFGVPICIGGQVHAAMAKIQKEVEAVGKTGKNTQQNYSYRPIDQFMNALNRVMAENGVTVRPVQVETLRDEYLEVEGYDGRKKTKHAAGRRVRFMFQHEDGSFILAQTDGYGEDYGDKSVNKAMSFAFKYLLMETFMVPTESISEGDAESTEVTEKKTAAKSKSSANGSKKKTFDVANLDQVNKKTNVKVADSIEKQLEGGKTVKDIVKELEAAGFQVTKAAAKKIDELATKVVNAS